MKRVFTILLITAAGGWALAQDSLPNASFEHWLANPLYDELADWNSTNDIIGNFIQCMSQTTDAADGNYAVRLESKYFPLAGQAVPGAVTTADIAVDANFHPVFTGGAPFSKMPVAVTGMYQYAPTPGDTGAISIVLTHYDAANDTTLVVGMGGFFFIDSTSGYTPFVAPVTNFLPMPPDTMMVLISSSILTIPPTGSVLIVDALGFTWPAGTWGPGDEATAVIYPNPASSEAVMALPAQWNGYRLELYDLLGNRFHREIIRSSEVRFSVYNFPDGLYFYSIISPQGEIAGTGKFQVRH